MLDEYDDVNDNGDYNCNIFFIDHVCSQIE